MTTYGKLDKIKENRNIKPKKINGTNDICNCSKTVRNKGNDSTYRTKSICSRPKMSFCSQKFSTDPFLLDGIRRITLSNLQDEER